ncbi:hypothetical protein [Enterococcus sp. AZ192]|uniref:hypothetical protein n=1 Tax=unclassified Enterococcus TaxID=2608891 RepID=UPI003D29D8A6
MKKIILSSLIFVCFGLNLALNAEADELPEGLEIEIGMQDLTTGEMLTDNLEITDVKTREGIKKSINPFEENYISEIEVSYSVPEDQNLRAQNTNTSDQYGVAKAYVLIDYDVSGQTIRINGGGCSWTLNSSLMSVYDRSFVLSAPFGVNILQRTPASNSYVYYSTGWGYVTNYGGTQRAYASSAATGGASGMTQYRLTSIVYPRTARGDESNEENK